MVNVITVASRKGGVGKSTIAYELAYCLDAVLLDLDWDAGAVTPAWGYRPETRATDALLSAIEHGRTPRPLKGFRKPRLVPHSPDLVDLTLSAETWRDLIDTWSQEWGSEWVVVDTHPGVSEPGNGAMSLANLILSPFALRTKELAAVEQMVLEMADYPLAMVPNFVPTVPPASEVRRLQEIIEGTPVQVTPFVPHVLKIGTRKRRMAMTAENPTPRVFQPAVERYRQIAEFAKEYVK
ncbi:ParA family protein [Luteococcus sp.]|uniref:ParA family protein n=1 Tax=Luteococcus sp. TaxID=1969402 RepID=UPI0037368D7D